MKGEPRTETVSAVGEVTVEHAERAPYERPSLIKKRSVARVTLFSGSGASGASGLTSA